ncbi:MAG: Gfo/Idh/MocA family oxidoreductase [Pirellulales bacterium]|nr:Gfo/Idh/MocA family oxidoreductase [Pirellulales bacterium]
MATASLNIGIVGLGANTRLRHLPGLRAIPGVEIAAVVNRRPESTRAAAAEFSIPRTFDRWEDLVADPAIDAVMIGTWPYLHCPVTLAALAAGKHVLTEARMAMNAAEAHQMLVASNKRPELTCQIVPSPFGLRGDRQVRQLLAAGALGTLREVAVLGVGDALADPLMPLHWRQVGALSGLNVLTLGIVHETLCRWLPDPVRVFAQMHAFISERLDPETGLRRRVGTPDSVQALVAWDDGARGLYHFSGVSHFGPGMQIHLYGSEGTLRYELAPHERLLWGRRGDAQLTELPLPSEAEAGWRVEADFVAAIRGEKPVEYTDFVTGVRYMEFTEAVARSATSGQAVELPLGEP